MFECGGESSSFFMISNLTSFEDKGSVCSGAVESCASSLISIGIVGLGSQSGDSYSMMQWRCRNEETGKKAVRDQMAAGKPEGLLYCQSDMSQGCVCFLSEAGCEM